MRRPTRASHAPSLARALFHSLESLKNVPLYIFFHIAHTLPPQHALAYGAHTLHTTPLPVLRVHGSHLLCVNPAHMRRPTRASHAPSLARALFHSLESLKNVPLYIFFHTAHTLPPHTLLPTVHTLSTPRLFPSYACMEAICYA